MKRTGFKRPTLERVRSPLIPMHGRSGVIAPVGDVVVAVPKEEPVRSEAYRRLVAALPCDRCKCVGLTQAAHADFRKGMAIKTCDLTCYPLCGPDYMGHPGCHYLIGTGGEMTKDRRRQYEAEAGARTRLRLLVDAEDDARVRKVLQSVGLLP